MKHYTLRYREESSAGGLELAVTDVWEVFDERGKVVRTYRSTSTTHLLDGRLGSNPNDTIGGVTKVVLTEDGLSVRVTREGVERIEALP